MTRADLGLAVLANVVVFGLAAWAMLQRPDAPLEPSEVVPIGVVSAGGSPAATKPGFKAAKSSRKQRSAERAAEPPVVQPEAAVPQPEVATSPNATPQPPKTASPSPVAGEASDPVDGEDEPSEADSGTGTGTGTGTGEAEAGAGSENSGPMFDRAVGFYRARLVGWFSTRFRVRGSGLSKAELERFRVTAEIDVAPDLQVTSYRIVSSDHPLFEAAARKTLEATLGQKLPPPPSAYPGAVQSRITVIFTCSEQTCD